MSDRSEKKNKQRFWGTITAVIVVLLLFAMPTIVIDPYFHYHGPISDNGYTYAKQRYINDGIVRHFDYTAIITGTSMSENFSASEAEELFGYDFIKVPYPGGYYKELDHLMKRAFTSDNDIKIVIRGLDYSLLCKDKDAVHEEADPLRPRYSAPDYIVNSNPFDDVKYVLNKTVLLDDTLSTYKHIRAEIPTTSFDKYSTWAGSYTFNRETVLSTYTHKDKAKEEAEYTYEDRELVKGNVEQNLIATVNEHPDTIFYFFFTPYSICYWDECNAEGTINRNISAEKTAIELLLECPNVKLFSFTDDFELTCDLDNYKDQAHYGPMINSDILKRMRNNENLLTKDNYQEYIEKITEFYNNYDYTEFEVR